MQPAWPWQPEKQHVTPSCSALPRARVLSLLLLHFLKLDFVFISYSPGKSQSGVKIFCEKGAGNTLKARFYPNNVRSVRKYLRCSFVHSPFFFLFFENWVENSCVYCHSAVLRGAAGVVYQTHRVVSSERTVSVQPTGGAVRCFSPRGRENPQKLMRKDQNDNRKFKKNGTVHFFLTVFNLWGVKFHHKRIIWEN